MDPIRAQPPAPYQAEPQPRRISQGHRHKARPLRESRSAVFRVLARAGLAGAGSRT
jgi:hypothetical protein